MKWNKPVTVSEARSNLYGLVEYVTEDPDAAVVIEHRSRKERAVLVDESRLKYLEAIEQEYRKRTKPFRVKGSLKINVPADELGQWIDENRRRQAELSEARMKRIFEED